MKEDKEFEKILLTKKGWNNFKTMWAKFQEIDKYSPKDFTKGELKLLMLTLKISRGEE